MSETNQFGKLLSPHTIENDMVAHLKYWMPSYLGEWERETGRKPGELVVMTYTTKTKFDRFPEEEIPMMICISPGTIGKPWKQGRSWSARWLLRVTAVCSAPTEDVTRELAHIYMSAAKDIVEQYQGINNNPSCEGVDWAGDVYSLIGSSQTRTLAASQVVFHAQYCNVVDESQGPEKPTADETAPTDPGPWPLVGPGGATTTIQKEPI
jgi:hypothetical protein